MQGGSLWEIVLSFEFHQNWLSGFQDAGVLKFALSIALAAGLYNNLHTSCNDEKLCTTDKEQRYQHNHKNEKQKTTVPHNTWLPNCMSSNANIAIFTTA